MDIEAQKKYSYLDEYKIIRTLGAGYHAQVKLGMDDNGNLYAIKRYKKQTANLSVLQHELNVMKILQHENLVHLVDVRESAIYKRKDQTTFQCFAIILEYIGGGELFDFIAETGRFSEKVSRTYFHQMMNGLHFMHTKGYAHRDIKPENILLARDFTLKLADFGFSCLIKGKDGSGVLHTKLGTEGYMAPEVPTKNYDGAKVDVFASGVILFIMYAGNPPFEKAAANDPYYRLIKEKNYATFWKAHSRRRPANFFSDSFKDIFVRMVSYNPTERPKIEEIAVHPWVKNVVCSQNQIRHEFEERFKKLEVVLDERRKQQEEQKQNHIQNSNNMGGNRGDVEVDTQFQELYEKEIDLERKLGELLPLSADDLVLDENPTYAIAILKEFFKNKKILIQEDYQDEDPLYLRAVEVHDDKNILTAKYQYEFEVEGEKFSQSVEIGAEFGLSADNNLIVCLRQQSGNRLYFKKITKEIKNLFAFCKK